MRRSIFSCVLFLGACTSSHVPSESDGGTCVEEFAVCERDEDCCGEHYCSGPYGPSVCTPRSPDGTFCVSSRECQTGTCVENVCGGVVATCVPAGGACGGGGCCAGTACRADASGVATCLPPGADGEACASASDCASTVCTAGVCGVPTTGTCMARGEFDCLTSGVPCCEGSYCEPAGGYYEGYCLELAADGAACTLGFGRCASGRCEEGICRAASCVAIGTECIGTPGECCTGFCDAGFRYGPTFCTERRPAGGECYDASWCLSGVCGTTNVCL